MKTFLGPELASAYANDEPKDRDVAPGLWLENLKEVTTAAFFV